MELTKVSPTDGVSVFHLSGRLDTTTAPELENEQNALFKMAPKGFIIDLADIQYISSPGIRVLMVAAKTMKKNGGTMVLCCLREHVMEVFEIAGLKAIFKIVETQKEALASIDS